MKLRAGVQIVFCLFLTTALLTACGSKTEEAASNEPSKPKAAEQSRDRGEQIIAEYLKADAAAFRKTRLRFTVTSDTDPAQVYELDVWRKQTPDETLTLSHIIKPVEDSQISSLAAEAADKETVITTYAPGTDQFRETGSNKAFFGGVPAQELLGEWSKYAWRFVGEKDLNGVKVLEVEGKLKPSKRSPAAQINGYFRADNYLPVELHVTDGTGKELRTFRIRNYQTTAGKTYVSSTEIENHVYKTRVTVDVLSMSFPDQIENAVFTREQLKKNAGK